MENLKKVSKAQQKRDQDRMNAITNITTIQTMEFRNEFIQAIMDQDLELAEKNVKAAEEALKSDLNSYDKAYAVRKARTILSRRALITLKAGKEAEAIFNQKMEKMIQKLFEFGFGWPKLETIGSAGWKHGFTFLFTEGGRGHMELMEAEARFTWVDGFIRSNPNGGGYHSVRPHFRFIVTKRKQK